MKFQENIQEYAFWRQKKFDNRAGFFPVFSDFTDIMKKISPGAISLYIYFGLHSNYKTGEVFHSLSTIAIFFNRSQRTISNWVRELEDNGLIVRGQKKLNGVSHTYLIPYEKEKKIDKDSLIIPEKKANIQFEIMNYLYFDMKYDPSEFVEEYNDNNNKIVREKLEKKFPSLTIAEIKSGWEIFYNMPPQELDK